MSDKNKIQVFGWFGVIAILLGYFLISFNFVTSSNIWYQLLNLIGALAIVIETYSKKDYQPLFLNIFWALIAAIVVVRIFS